MSEDDERCLATKHSCPDCIEIFSSPSKVKWYIIDRHTDINDFQCLDCSLSSVSNVRKVSLFIIVARISFLQSSSSNVEQWRLVKRRRTIPERFLLSLEISLISFPFLVEKKMKHSFRRSIFVWENISSMNEGKHLGERNDKCCVQCSSWSIKSIRSNEKLFPWAILLPNLKRKSNRSDSTKHFPTDDSQRKCSRNHFK